jgi:outer membrane protein OmpA-like peptidoglycan-associated protein
MSMDGQAKLAAPVTAFFSALEVRDRNLAVSVLAQQVRLEVPSLGLRCTGQEEVLGAIGAVLVAFPDFRYRIRSRYVAPEQVTDEAVLEGTWTGPLLDRQPRGVSGMVPARMMLTHDGKAVTTMTLWADAGALHDLFGLSETLPSSSPLVSRLRATLPATEGRVIIAQERDSGTAEREPPFPQRQVVLPPRPRVTSRGTDPRAPVPRRIRRLQAAALALLMVGASSALFAWVVNGTVRATADRSHPQAAATPAADPAQTRQPPSTAESGPGSPLPLRFDATRNEFEFSSDALFFDTDSSTLTPNAQAALAKVVAQIRSEQRYGRVTVTGYTDQRGPAKYNLKLSQARADAVATALRQALAGLPDRVAVDAVGRGEEDPIVTKGTTSSELAPNRRVTIQVPSPH